MPEHSAIGTADLHNSYVLGFTTDPETWTPPEADILACHTPTNAIYRTTGTNAGDVALIGSADAAAWLNGSGAPASGLGNDGDRYTDDDTGDYYGKASGSWVLLGNLRGPTAGIRLTFDAGTASGAGAGEVRLSNADPSAATEIHVSTSDADGASITEVLEELTIGTKLLIFEAGTPANKAFYELSGVATGAGSDRTLPVAYVSHTNTFADGDLLSLSYFAKGGAGGDGTDGATWLNDSGAPAGGLGEVGDFYLNSDNGDYYKKTASDTWTLQGSLKGNDGADGTQWFTGSGAPGSGLGEVGDFYLDSSNGDYYEKTGAFSWTLRGNLSGDDGTDGIDAIATTTADFTQPTESATVSVSVNSTAGLAVGAILYTSANSGNYYQVDSITNATTVILENLADYGNAASSTTISSGAVLVPSGLRGAQGIQGDPGSVSSASALTFTHQASDPSTAADETDLFVDTNGIPKYRDESDGEIHIIANTELVENAQTGTAYTLTISDAFKGVTFSNAGAITATVPANSTAAFPVGTQIIIGLKGTGTVTLSPAAGVNLNGENSSIVLSEQWMLVMLWQYEIDNWWVAGGIS